MLYILSHYQTFYFFFISIFPNFIFFLFCIFPFKRYDCKIQILLLVSEAEYFRLQDLTGFKP